MTSAPAWLPALVRFEDYDGTWRRYIDAVFALFYRDFIQSQPRLCGRSVRCRREPLCEGKEAGFWHCVSEGPDEGERTPDLRRCERIAWVRAILEHADDQSVQLWFRRKNRDRRCYLWYDESFLVVLGERQGHYQLITAFCTDREHTKEKLRREVAESRNG